MSPLSLLGKAGHPDPPLAADYARAPGCKSGSFLSTGGGPRPWFRRNSRRRCLVSYPCPWIVPARLLEASALSLDFHPGPAEYPEIESG